MNQLEELRLEEGEILRRRAHEKGEAFDRLTEELFAVRRKIMAIEPIPTIGQILAEKDFCQRVTELRQILE